MNPANPRNILEPLGTELLGAMAINAVVIGLVYCWVLTRTRSTWAAKDKASEFVPIFPITIFTLLGVWMFSLLVIWACWAWGVFDDITGREMHEIANFIIAGRIVLGAAFAWVVEFKLR